MKTLRLASINNSQFTNSTINNFLLFYNLQLTNFRSRYVWYAIPHNMHPFLTGERPFVRISLPWPHSSSGPGRGPLKAETGVRVPYGAYREASSNGWVKPIFFEPENVNREEHSRFTFYIICHGHKPWTAIIH